VRRHHSSGTHIIRDPPPSTEKEDQEKKLQEAERLRKQREAEEKLIEEETARRVEEEIRSRVEAALNSDAVQKVIHQRLKDERAKLEARVTEQLRQEEKALLDSAHAKRDKDQCEKEALERMLAENAQRVEEAQRAAEARRVADEEERYARLAAPRAISNKIKTVQLSHTPQVASCVVPGRAAASLWALANQPFFRALSLGVCHLHKRWSRV